MYGIQITISDVVFETWKLYDCHYHGRFLLRLFTQ